MQNTTIDNKSLGNRQYSISRLVNNLHESIYQVDYRVTRDGKAYGPVNRLKSDGVVITDGQTDYRYKGFASLDSALKAIEKHAQKPYVWKQKAA